MKRSVVTSFFTLMTAAAVFASGVENKTNLSTGYLRNPSRNTENSRPEAAFYNIAGTAFLKEGLWIGGGNQFVFKEYGNELADNATLKAAGVNGYYSNDETTVWLYPDLNAVYKKGKWSIFGNFGVYAGGGALEYSEGTSATSLLFAGGAQNQGTEAVKYGLAANMISKAKTSWEDAVKNNFGGSEATALAYIKANPTSDLAQAYGVVQKYGSNLSDYASKKDTYEKAAAASLGMAKSHSLDVTSITYGLQLGASYQLFDYVSLAAAYRYTIGTQEMTLKCSDPTFVAVNGGNKISYDAKGFGQSCVFGIHAKPVDKLDLAIQYQTLSRIDYDVDNVKGDVAKYYDITNDKKFRTDLPAVLNLGLGYSILDNLYVSTSFNYYFNDFAQQNSVLSETDYNNSWEIALGVDFRFCKYAGVSAGASYGNQGTTDTSNSTFNPVLDNWVVGGGFEIYPTEDLTVTASCLYANYYDTDLYLQGYKTTLSKDVTNFGIGVTYHFPNL
ncbi:OmpP1/FadL family transporter [uncultured Treponema sp.]|uniref:OmpP1/FadL family transporter n=1 Tax=uncultured Treponema sp. TaxID=162155 RepID=UPI0025EED941|nr:outer membrane beta-barrel protein [uncultured Treponema sp.]